MNWETRLRTVTACDEDGGLGQDIESAMAEIGRLNREIESRDELGVPCDYEAIREAAAQVVKLYVPPYTDQDGFQPRDLDRAIASLRIACRRNSERQ